MAPLQDKINADIKQAMLDKNAPKLSALRMLKSALMNAEIEKKGAAMSDADVQGIIQKGIKQRRESVEQYEKGGRADLAATEKAEIAVLEAYLPKQMDPAKLEAIVKETLAANSLSSKKDFGKAMKLVQDKVQGGADNKRISELLNKVLA